MNNDSARRSLDSGVIPPGVRTTSTGENKAAESRMTKGLQQTSDEHSSVVRPALWSDADQLHKDQLSHSLVSSPNANRDNLI